MGAVVAARRAGDEHTRPRVLGQRPQAGDEVARADLTALADGSLGLLRPALGDVLAGEVDDRVAPLERLSRSRSGERVPGDRAAAGAAREDGDLVAAGPQALDEE